MRWIRIFITFAGVLMAYPMHLAHAQDAYPTRPIKIVVPFPPGGSVDVVARLLVVLLQERLGQPVVVENRPGAVGTIGSNAVARAAPDGHTFLMTIGAHTIVPALMQPMPYDAAADFAPVSLLASARNVLVARLTLQRLTCGLLSEWQKMIRQESAIPPLATAAPRT